MEQKKTRQQFMRQCSNFYDPFSFFPFCQPSSLLMRQVLLWQVVSPCNSRCNQYSKLEQSKTAKHKRVNNWKYFMSSRFFWLFQYIYWHLIQYRDNLSVLLMNALLIVRSIIWSLRHESELCNKHIECEMRMYLLLEIVSSFWIANLICTS